MDNLRYHNSHTHHLRHQPFLHTAHNSVPNSPNEMDLGLKSTSNSANTSPISANKWDGHPSSAAGDASSTVAAAAAAPLASKSSYTTTNNFVRTSRSEDQLQAQSPNPQTTNENDDDITSSLNTLLDTRPEGGGDSDRIVWTYNAPCLSNGSDSTSPTSSPLHSTSPASPTSVSSSVMSSQSGSRRVTHSRHTNGDFSVSEAISNISSPDYHDDDSMGIRDCNMEISDPSDSDSTLLVSEPRQRRGGGGDSGEHRIVIQVKGPDNKKTGGCDTEFNKATTIGYDCSNSDFMVGGFVHHEDQEEHKDIGRGGSPLSSEDESDVESLHSFHYSPKAVDLPSAIRLAKRLYGLDGFKKSDVSRHLSKK